MAGKNLQLLNAPWLIPLFMLCGDEDGMFSLIILFSISWVKQTGLEMMGR